MKWEYKKDVFKISKLSESLNAIGQDQWELVTADFASDGLVYCIFKKSIEEIVLLTENNVLEGYSVRKVDANTLIDSITSEDDEITGQRWADG